MRGIFLQKTFYNDCLCSNCMVAIDNMVQFVKQHTLPVQKEVMIEDLHYYMENGNFVFTELYHGQRGFCCGKYCRHCAYGNTKKYSDLRDE